MMDYAFPVTFKYCIGHNVQGEPMYSEDTQPGMTLRDYFAAKAMGGFAADPNYGAEPERMAEYAYKWADAMLAERKKPK